MALTDTDLAWIRDEIGTATPPTDDDLYADFDLLGSREKVALRVLKRRLAAVLASPGSFSVSGAFGVSRGDPTLLARQVARLEGLVRGLDYQTTAGRLVRTDTVRPG